MPKKILREGIFKRGFLEPLDIELEGLDTLREIFWELLTISNTFVDF